MHQLTVAGLLVRCWLAGRKWITVALLEGESGAALCGPWASLPRPIAVAERAAAC